MTDTPGLEVDLRSDLHIPVEAADTLAPAAAKAIAPWHPDQAKQGDMYWSFGPGEAGTRGTDLGLLEPAEAGTPGTGREHPEPAQVAESDKHQK